MRGLQKYAKNWNLGVAFWATCKIGQPIQPIWQQFFALPWSALKKPSWELNFLHIFAVPLSSRYEKCCQILDRLFVLFHHFRNILCLYCKVHIFWEGRKVLRNLRRRFDWHYIGQIYGGDYAKFWGLIRIYGFIIKKQFLCKSYITTLITVI